MRILITGGSGFIGTRLVTELCRLGHNVTIFDKAPSHAFPELVIRGDVRDQALLTDALQHHDAVFHLAAEHSDDVTPLSLYDEVNIGGAENLTRAMDIMGCRWLIFTSSVAVYPLNAVNPTEEHETRPFNHYGHSKLGAENVFKKWFNKCPDARLSIVRPCVVFGERNRGNVYNLLHQISRGRFIMVGSGRNYKSMAYVGNIVPFLVSRLDAESGLHVMNYADKPDLCTEEIVSIANQAFGRNGLASQMKIPYSLGLLGGLFFDALSRVTGRKYALSKIRIEKFCADTTVSADRIEQIGFQRPYLLTEGITRMIESEFLSKDQSGPLFESAGG
jgi:nucleoside-diphosphate-sugar epimerase